MKRSAFRLTAALALALAVPAPLAAQNQINVRDADVRAFLTDAARVTGRTFVVDGRVQARVTAVTDRPLSRAEYFEVVLSTLRANGLVAIPMGNGAYRVQPAEGAATQPSRLGSRGAPANALVTDVIRLQRADAASAIETLRPLVSSAGSLTANRAANSLVIADYADNVRRIRALAATLDRDTTTQRIINLRNAGAREIAESLRQLGGAAAPGAPGGVSIAPFDGSNSVAIRGDAREVERLAALAQQLDTRAASAAEIRVYTLQHADAARLLPTLQQLIGGGSDPAGPATGASQRGPSSPYNLPEGGNGNASQPIERAVPAQTTAGGGAGNSIVRRGPAIVTRYEGVNAIIVAANPDVQRQLGELIRQLDVRRPQVLVEAIVVEIGDAAARQLGVQFLLGGRNAPFLATNYSNANPSILGVGAAVGGYLLSQQTTTINGNIVTTTNSNPFGPEVAQGAIQQLLNAAGGFAGFAGDIGRNTIFGAIINAVQSDTASNLLATPHIVTLDNQPARFLVGQDVPITTGERLSQNFDNAFRTVQREEVGIKLEVTPQINASGEIKLYLRQEVSSVAGPVSSRSSDLIINKRAFDTVLTVDDGEILAIGGLLNDDERRTIERIPLLSDIPIIGQLFRSRSRSRSKTNLMVFIRPTILNNREDNAAMTAQRYGYIRREQWLRNPDAEPEIDNLVRDYLGTVPPVVTSRPDDVLIAPSAIIDARPQSSAPVVVPIPPSQVPPSPIPPVTAAPPPPR